MRQAARSFKNRPEEAEAEVAAESKSDGPGDRICEAETKQPSQTVGLLDSPFISDPAELNRRELSAPTRLDTIQNLHAHRLGDSSLAALALELFHMAEG